MPPVDPIAELVADRERARATADPFTDRCILGTADETARRARRLTA